MRRARLLAAGLAWLAAARAAAAPVAQPHVTADLVARETGVAPGTTAWVGLVLTLERGWHVYWTNPGDSGIPPALAWRLPKGFTAGAPAWPAPERIPDGPLMTFGYHGTLLLPVPVAVPAHARPGTTVRLAATATWLVCKDICIPGKAELTLELPVVAGPPSPGPAADRFARAAAAAPAPLPAGWTVRAEADARTLTLAVRGAVPRGDAYFYPLNAGQVEPAKPQRARRGTGELRLALVRSDQLRELPATLEGVLAVGGRAFTVTAPFPGAPGGLPAPRAPMPAGIGLTWALVLAFAGGLILNLMPCVFPVLSLKVIGFMRQAVHHPHEVRLHGALYTAGVLASFWALAGSLIVLRSGGQQLGWGFQLQSPAVVLALTGLLFLISLNLLGVFETGTSVVAAIGQHAHAEGRFGAFFSGVLATVLATPCTAPFMGTAVGFAATLPSPQALLVFTSLALGMAAPYAALSCAPGLGALLPRPGRWMETFKQAMAFPLLATDVWLLWVVGLQAGLAAVAAALGALVILALGGWAYGRWHDARGRLVLAAALAAAVLAAGAGLRHGAAPPPSAAGGWEPYSRARLDALRAADRPVFVDFTAAWCLTCKVNEAVALDTPEVRDALASRNVALLRGDWTNPDPEIERALGEFGRNGVPLYVLYTGGPGAPPVVLPQVLTPRLVLSALAGLPVRSPGGRR